MNNHVIVIGEIKLKKRMEFTQYGEHAAWTDYVTCDPQTATLKYDGYWVFASFDGVLTASTYLKGAREVGQPARAAIQTQAWGGIGNWFQSEAFGIDNDSYKIEITNPDYIIDQVSTYDDGRPMFALKSNAATAQPHE